MDWEKELCIEDVQATAIELMKQNGFISPPSPTTTPKPSPFLDAAVKSQDWAILQSALDDAVFDNSFEKVNEPAPKNAAPDVFTSRDWVLNEILESQKEVSLSPDMFVLDQPAPKAPQVDETDWEALFMDQLAQSNSSNMALVSSHKEQPRKRKRKKRPKVVPDSKEYVNVSCNDVLLGRGGKSNHHPGNKRYREEIQNFRPMYATLETDQQKTKMSQDLVDVIQRIGGRFLEEDKVKAENGSTVSLGWYVVPNIVARRKASQALREDNDPEKRKAKRARFLAKKKATRGY
eukprot:scaffold874_cov126-Cylindrotheca_fusiformis.AAC.13